MLVCFDFCLTCVDTATNCQSCIENRILPPNCSCPSGFYDNK